MPVTETAFMMLTIICLLAGFAFILRFFRAWLLHSTLRKAIDKDSAAAPALIDRIAATDNAENSLGNDDRNGMVLIALGLAMAGFGIIGFGNDMQTMRVMLGAGLFPLLVGIALLIRRKLLKRELAGHDGAATDHGA